MVVPGASRFQISLHEQQPATRNHLSNYACNSDNHGNTIGGSVSLTHVYQRQLVSLGMRVLLNICTAGMVHLLNLNQAAAAQTHSFTGTPHDTTSTLCA